MSAKKQTNLFKFFGTPNSGKKLESKTTPKENDTPKANITPKAGRKRIINDSDNDSGSDNECIQTTKKSRIKTISSSSNEDDSAPISTSQFSTPKHQKPISRGGFLSTPTSSKKSTSRGGFLTTPSSSKKSTSGGGFLSTPSSSKKSTSRGGFLTTPSSSKKSTSGGGFLSTPSSSKKTLQAKKNNSNNKENMNDQVLSLRSECIKSNKLPHQVVADKNFDLDNRVMDIGMDTELTPGNHQNLPFLQPGVICDKQRRKPFTPDWDPKTLYIPPDFLKQQSPGMRQWWEIKSDHFDCILFFKVGKFYELYHMDAVVGVKKLGLTYMKGNYAHCGFPEPSYGRMAATLVEMGYKVARVEQTETPEMLAERNIQKVANKTIKEKVVRREVCQVTTKGTKVFGVHDIESNNFEATYLLAIIETNDLMKRDCIETSVCTYGVCLVETSLGVFHIGQFEDDLHRSNLLLMLTHYPPGLILYPRNGISERTENLFKTMVPATVHRERLIPTKQFLNATDTINFLLEHQYFNDSNSSNNQWPGVLKDFFQGDNMYSTFIPDDAKLAVQAFGATCWYLNYSKLDEQILSMKNFKHFKLPGSDIDGDDSDEIYNSNMIIDAITMHHLRILDNNNGLVKKLNLCKTAFGKRLLRSWITQPLCCVDTIQERLNAVETILNCGTNFIKSIQKHLQKLPDLERLITRITGLGNKKHAKHPDSRAVFFDKNYSKTKIIDFCKLIDGFTLIVNEIISEISSEVGDSDMLIKRLTTLISVNSDGEYPDYRKDIQYIRKLFDFHNARSEGIMIPPAHLNEDYDKILKTIKEFEEDLEEYRIEQCQLLKCNITYYGNDKKRFQLSVPMPKTKSNVNVPNEYQLESATKTVKRYSTKRTKQLLAAVIAAEEKKAKILQKYASHIFEEFSKNNEKWLQALKCISYIDILFSFAAYSNADNMCKPVIRKPNKNEKPFINIVGGRHACIAKDNFIPNDISIGANDIASLILLTGPNMGGKSTIMRTCALITIIGQLGCYVPANECEFTIVDRIFTRIGARDNIELGHSTFYVELEETYSILKYASRYSLALLDELGRGTSTFDGMCIADGVIWYLAQCQLRTIASTHYHQLVDKYIEDKTFKDIITLQYMACFVDVEDGFECSKYGKIVDRIVYLYKLTLGACPKSFGFNVAHSAQLPNSIIKRGRQMAEKFEAEARLIREFDKLIQF